MNRRGILQGAVLGMVGFAVGIGKGQPAVAAPSDALYAKCAKACADCATACQKCNKHCLGMIKAGMKEHARSARLSADCMDICALAARLCKRKGPLTIAACEACLKACKTCGAECEKYPTMPEMAACGKSCASCAKVCQEMIAAAK